MAPKPKCPGVFPVGRLVEKPESTDPICRSKRAFGVVGRYVIENLEDLRVARRLTYRQLADRLEKLGRPIPTLGLSRIEKGNRRVDVDDLVALVDAGTFRQVDRAVVDRLARQTEAPSVLAAN